MSNFYFQFFANSDVGVGYKKTNEDAFITGKKILGVFDGLGGIPGGGLASQFASNFIKKYLEASGGKFKSPKRFLKSIFIKAHQELIKLGKSDKFLANMATTATTAILFKNNLYITHVGDCRAYIKKDKSVIQLTVDHSPPRSIDPYLLYSYLGGAQREIPRLDLVTYKPKEGEILIINSDGITDNLSKKEFQDIVVNNSNLSSLGLNLIRKAKKNNFKPDNMTVVVGRITS